MKSLAEGRPRPASYATAHPGRDAPGGREASSTRPGPQRGATIVGAISLLLSAASWAQPDTALYERLYTGCRGVDVEIFVEDKAQSLGVADSKRLETMAESRLRAARLYEPHEGLPVLYIRVQALDGDSMNAFRYEIDVDRRWVNPDTARSVSACAWTRGGFGYFGDQADPSSVVHARISDYIDEFIRDYLRVNEGACD